MDLATTITPTGTIPPRCPVRVLAVSTGSAAIQRIPGGPVELCDRADLLTASEIADYATATAPF